MRKTEGFKRLDADSSVRRLGTLVTGNVGNDT